MPASRYDITIEQGATFAVQLTLRLNSTQALDLTGYSIRSQMRKDFADSTPINFTISNRNDPQGSFVLGMSATDTGVLEPRKYFYDLEIESPGGTVSRALEGTVTVKPEVTR